MIPLLIAYSLIWHPALNDASKQDLRLEMHVEDHDIIDEAS